MNQVSCEWMNKTYVANGCNDLRVLESSDGTRHSVWRPNAEEVIAIMEGRPILLFIQGCQPPVAVEVLQDDLPDENGKYGPSHTHEET